MMRSRRLDRVSLAAAAWLMLPAAGAGAGQDAAQVAVREGVARRTYISVTDARGAVVTDLTPQEVTVKEDGKAREVIAVGPASDTMSIVMLIDDSGPGIQHVREGVAAFLRVLQRNAEIAIVSTAGQNSVVVDFTTDHGALMNGVNRLSTRTTSGGYLLEAIQEGARTLARREAVRPVIVVLALEGTEYSNVSAAKVLEEVRLSRAVVHALTVGKPSMKTMTAWGQRATDSIHEALDETMVRHAVLAEAPRRTGGRLEQLGQATGIVKRLSEIAYELRDQLAVTYGRPPSAAAERLDISVKRRGVKLRAPKYVS